MWGDHLARSPRAKLRIMMADDIAAMAGQKILFSLRVSISPRTVSGADVAKINNGEINTA